MLFKFFSPSELRRAIEEEMQKCDDPVQASYNAMARLKKEKAPKEQTTVEKLRASL
jgi:hypothetical protein